MAHSSRTIAAHSDLRKDNKSTGRELMLDSPCSTQSFQVAAIKPLLSKEPWHKEIWDEGEVLRFVVRWIEIALNSMPIKDKGKQAIMKQRLNIIHGLKMLIKKIFKLEKRLSKYYNHNVRVSLGSWQRKYIRQELWAKISMDFLIGVVFIEQWFYCTLEWWHLKMAL